MFHHSHRPCSWRYFPINTTAYTRLLSFERTRVCLVVFFSNQKVAYGCKTNKILSSCNSCLGLYVTLRLRKVCLSPSLTNISLCYLQSQLNLEPRFLRLFVSGSSPGGTPGDWTFLYLRTESGIPIDLRPSRLLCEQSIIKRKKLFLIPQSLTWRPSADQGARGLWV